VDCIFPDRLKVYFFYAMASAMDIGSAVAAGVSAGLSQGGSRKRARGSDSSRSRKKSRSNKISRGVAWKGEILPPVLKTKLKYTENVYASSAGGDYTYIFRLNSIYDFDYSGGGHQPMGHDQLSTLYDHYKVTGVRWVVKAYLVDNTDVRPMRCAAWVNDVTSNAATQSEAEEQAGAKNAMALYGGRDAGYLSGYTDIATVFGLTKEQSEGDGNLISLFGANPANQVYLHLRFQTGVATFAVNFQIYATIDVECKSPKALALS